MNSEYLSVFEIFSSIQGESTFVGLPFVFVRLAGCNLKCSWCDTPKAQILESAKRISPAEITANVLDFGLKHVCITGGEPLMQDATPSLCELLLKEQFIVTLETNGSLDISRVPAGVIRVMDLKCPSSGMSDYNNLNNIQFLTSKDEIKLICACREDYEFAINLIRGSLRDFQGSILISPVWERLNPADLAKWVLSDRIPVRVHLQLHKILGVN